MDRNTPREIMRGFAKSSKGNSNEKETRNASKGRQTPSLRTPRNLRSSSSPSPLKSSPLKRPAHESLVKKVKRKKQSFSSPSDTITMRTNIKAVLKAADTETPLQHVPSHTSTGEANNGSLLQEQGVCKSFQQPISTKSNIEFRQRLRSASSPNTSLKKRSGGSIRKVSGRNQSFSSPSETITPRVTMKNFLRTETAPEKGETPVDKKSGELQEEQSKSESLLEPRKSSHLPEDPKFPEEPADDAKTEEFAGSIGETEVAGSPQNEVTYEMSDVSNERHSADDNIGWSKLKTPMLPNETIAKASPVVLTKPPTSSKHKQKLRNLQNARGKRNQPGTTNKNTSSKSGAVRLPLGLVKGIFNHFSVSKVSKDTFDVIQSGSDAFFKQLSSDLMYYCKHAKRKTIEQADVELLMRRQGLVSSKESFHALIERYLPMEYRQEIIPSARAGNKVVPKPK